MRSNVPWGIVPGGRYLPTTLPNKPEPRDDYRGSWTQHFEFRNYGKQTSTPEKFDRHDERLYQ
jgi:hypothetical protein